MRALVPSCVSLLRRCNTITVTAAISASRQSFCGSSVTNVTGRNKYDTCGYNTFVEVHKSRVENSISGGLTFPFMELPYSLSKSYPPIQVYPREIVFLIGAPGAGKGTHSTHIRCQRNFTAPTIVVSDLLNTPACKLLKDHGIMVDDHFVFNTLLTELQKPINRNGVVVDGFPRTAAQADFIRHFYYEQSHMSLTRSPFRILFVMLHVDEALSIERQLERGQQLTLLNKQLEVKGQPLMEIRHTDLTISATATRYQAFKLQVNAVQTLSQDFPLIVVEANNTINKIRAKLTEKMLSFPSAYVL
jgi:adenylate kinase family enzyme